MEEFKISLGVELNEAQLNTVKQVLKSIEDQQRTITYNVDFEIKNIDKLTKVGDKIEGIQEQISRKNKTGLSIDTKSLEAQLKKTHDSIKNIRKALGTVDSKKGVQSLLTTVNHISTALEKVSKQFEILNGSLSALSAKNFSLNFDFGFGKSGAKSPEDLRKEFNLLEKEALEYEKYFQKNYSKANKADPVSAFIRDYNPSKSGYLLNLQAAMANGAEPSAGKIAAYKEYIALIKESVALSNGKYSLDTPQFKLAESGILTDIQEIQNETDETEKKLKELFSGGINAEALSSNLDRIVKDLDNIDKVLTGLSSNFSIDKLSEGFNELSKVLGILLPNAELLENALGNGLANASNNVAKATQQAAQQAKKLIPDSAKKAIENVSSDTIGSYFRIDPSDSNAFRKEMEGLVNIWTNSKGRLEDIKIDTRTIYDAEAGANITKLHQAQVTYNNGLDETIKKTIAWRQIGTTVDVSGQEKALYGFVEVAGRYSKAINDTNTQTNNFVKQQKKAVSDFTNQINQLNRAANDQNANRPIKDQSHIDALENKYNEITAAIREMGNASGDAFIDAQNKVKGLISDFKSMTSEFRNAENVSTKMKGTNFASGLDIAKNDLAKFKADAKDIPQIAQTIKALNDAIEGVGDSASLNNFNDQLRVAKSELAKIKAETSTFNKAKDGIKSGSLEGQIDKLESSYKKLGITNEEVADKITKLKGLLSSIDSSDDIEVVTNDYKTFKETIASATEEVKSLERAQRESVSNQKLQIKKDAFSRDIDVWLKENTAATRQFGAEIESLKTKINSADATQLDGLKAEFEDVKKRAQLAGKATMSLGDKLKHQFSQYSTYFSVASMFTYIEQGIRSMYDSVVAIDGAMTNLMKVTDETDASYQNFLNNAGEKAQELGRSVSSFVEQTANWAKMGYSMAESSELAKISSIYSNVADVDDATAVSDIVTAMKAFNIEAENAISVIDPLNKLSNEFAVTAAGLGQGLTRAASTMATSGTDLEHTLALLAGISEITQSPEEAGNFLKTAVARIQGMKGKLEELGEEVDESVDSISKVQTQILNLTHGKVNIFDDNGEFRDYYEIMKDISEIVNELESTERAQLYEILFGKNRMNQGAAMIQAFQSGQIEAALESATNSAGSAMAEQEKWAKSLEAALGRLSAAWQDLSQSVMDSDFLKGLINGLTGFVNVIDTIVEKVGVLPTLLGGLSAFLSFKGINPFTSLFKEIASIKNAPALNFTSLQASLQADEAALLRYSLALKNGVSQTDAFNGIMLNASEAAQQFARTTIITSTSLDQFNTQQRIACATTLAQSKSLANVKSLINEYNAGCRNIGLTQGQFASAVGQSNSVLGNYLSGLNGAQASMRGYIGSLIASKAATLGLQVATMALNAALTMGISIAISQLISWITKLAKREEELIEKSETAAQAIGTLSNSFKETSNTVSDIVERFAELSQGVDKLSGKNISLSTDEYEEFLDLSNQLATLFPTLSRNYDENGNAIVQLSGNVDTIVSSLQNLLEVERQLTNLKIAENLPDLFSGIAIKSENLTNQIEELIKQRNALESQLEELQNPNFVDNFVESLESGLLTITSDSGSLDKLIEITDDYLAILDKLGLKYEYLSTEYEFDEELGIEVPIGYNYRIDFTGMSDEEIADAKEQIALGIQGLGEEYIVQINNLTTEIQSTINENKANWSSLLSSIFAWLSTDSSYQTLSDDMKFVVQSMINNIDFSSLNFSKWEDLENYIRQNIIKPIQNLSPEMQQAYSDLFAIKYDNKTTLEYIQAIKDKAKEIAENSDFTYDEVLKNTGYQDIIDTYEAMATDILRGLDDSVKEKFKSLEGTRNYNIYVKRGIQEIKDNLYNLSPDELYKVFDLVYKYGLDTWDEIEKALENKTFDVVLDYHIEAEGMENLYSAIGESVSAIGLTPEAIENIKARYQDLEDYDAAKLFEETANGIHLNVEALNELEDAYESQNKTDIDKKLEGLIEQYNNLTNEINNCSDASERAALYAQRDNILKEINDTATLAAQYEGLTSAYNKWLQAKSAGNERDMYEGILSGKKELEEELARGWIDGDTIQFLELLTGQNLSTAPIEDVIIAYQQLSKEIGNSGYTVWDFFTVDENGNSTSEGIYNFFDTIIAKRKEIQELTGRDDLFAWIDEDGNYNFDFGVDGDKAIAEALGISEELVQIILRAAQDAGFKVNFDSAYSELADFEDEVQGFNDRLKELGATEYTFNIHSTNIEDLDKQINEAKNALQNLKNEDGTLKINVNEEDVKNAQLLIASLLYQKQQLEKPSIMSVDTSGVTEASGEVEKAVKLIQELQAAYDNYEINVAVGADTTESGTELLNLINSIESLSPEVKASLGLDDEGFQAALDMVKAQITAGLELDMASVEIIESTISAITPEVLVKAGIDPTLVSEYEEAEHTTEGEVVWDNDTTKVDKYISEPHYADGLIIWDNDTKNVETHFEAKGTINWTSSGNAKVNGTAHAQGSAFAKGNWGTKDSGIALGGELGTETIVRDGHFFTIGDNGAEFFNYKKGDIIFNHKQTEELFKYGKVTSNGGRGRALANGTTYDEGVAFSNGSGLKRPNYGSSGSKDSSSPTSNKDSSSGGGGGSSSSSSADEFKETFDWIEIAIDRIERAIDRLDKKSGNIYKKWSNRNKSLKEEISKVREEIGLQQSAYERYMQEAESIGLDESWAELVRNGAIDITTITDNIDALISEMNEATSSSENSESSSEFRDWYEQQKKEVKDRETGANAGKKAKPFSLKGGGSSEKEKSEGELLAEKIKEYQEWYEKALDCQDAIEELKEKEAELYKQSFDNVITEYEGYLSAIEYEKNILEERIAQNEARGYIVNTEYYEALIEKEASNIAQLEEQREAMYASLEEAMLSGTIEEGSEAWQEMCSEINDVTLSIEEANTAMIEYNNSIREIEWQIFDLLQEKMSQVTQEADFLINLLSSDKLYDDRGQLTDEGMSTMGLHGMNYNTYMAQADKYAEELLKINEQIAKDPYNQDLLKRRQELLGLQRETILAAEDEKEAIVNMVREGIELELESLEKLIDKYTEALDSQKDLYDYQKKVQEQTEEITSLEKQKSAYTGDNSEEAKVKLQQLKVSLEEARENLEQTEYEKYISDQKQLLDKLYEEYELILNQRLDNVDALIADMIAEINTNASTISDTLSLKADEVGYILSDTMITTWDTATTNITDVLTVYGAGIQDSILSATTTLNSSLEALITNIKSMESNLASRIDTAISNAANSTQANNAGTYQVPTYGENSSSNNLSDTSLIDFSDPKKGKTVTVSPNAKIYDYAGDKTGERQYYKADPVYTVLETKNGYAKVRYHGLNSGVTGWFKESDLKNYATGVYDLSKDELAWTQENGELEAIIRPSDGAILTPLAKDDSVLKPSATSNIFDFANNPNEFIRDNLNLGAFMADTPAQNISGNTYDNDFAIQIELPNVMNYEQFKYAMQHDKNFEKMVRAMTVDKMFGGSSLKKYKC